MDPRDGHRECPTCLGKAHIWDDVESPCPAAIDLPLGERVRRARLQETTQPVAESSHTHGGGHACCPESQAPKQIKEKEGLRTPSFRTRQSKQGRYPVSALGGLSWLDRDTD